MKSMHNTEQKHKSSPKVVENIEVDIIDNKSYVKPSNTSAIKPSKSVINKA